VDPLSFTQVVQPGSPPNNLDSSSPSSAFKHGAGAVQVNHLIQLVPSIYEYWNGQSVEGYQYAVHTNYKYFSLQGVSFPLPGLFIKWDISPFVVKYRETGRSFAHFLTRVCAVTGGIFVVLGTWIIVCCAVSTSKTEVGEAHIFPPLGLLYNGTSKAMAAVKRKKAGSQKAF